MIDDTKRSSRCKIVIIITTTENEQLLSDLTSLLPGNWFVGAPTLIVDAEEVLMVGALSDQSPGGTDPIAFRETTRKERMKIAARFEAVAKRSIAWAVSANGAVRSEER